MRVKTILTDGAIVKITSEPRPQGDGRTFVHGSVVADTTGQTVASDAYLTVNPENAIVRLAEDLTERARGLRAVGAI
jgi:hypothetical protein